MVRPFPFLATLLTALALAFFIIAAATAHWSLHLPTLHSIRLHPTSTTSDCAPPLHLSVPLRWAVSLVDAAVRLISYQANVQVYEGPYNTCWRQHDTGIEECRHVNNDCTSDFSDPVGSFTVTDQCNAWRAVRAFLVLAILTSALAFLALYLSSFTKLRYPPLRPWALLLSFLAGLFGLIAWAIFISLSRSNTASTPHTLIDDWVYGFSFALLTAAWPLQWLCMLFAAIPFPYAPSAYDRARYQPEATTEEREAERQRALREGGVGAGLWSLLGVSPDKRRGYAERWGGFAREGGEKKREGEAERERERERQQAESQRSSTISGASHTGAPPSQTQASQLPPGMITTARTQPTHQMQLTGAQRV